MTEKRFCKDCKHRDMSGGIGCFATTYIHPIFGEAIDPVLAELRNRNFDCALFSQVEPQAEVLE